MNPETAERDVTIVQDILSGMSFYNVARKHNLSKSWVCRLIKKEYMQDLLNEGYTRYALMMFEVLNEFNNLLKHGKEESKVALIKDWTKNMGFAPTHTQNVFVQQIYNDNSRNITINPEIAHALSGASDYIDAEILYDSE